MVSWFAKLLEIVFKTCIQNGRFPLESKNDNVFFIHKKVNKQTIKNFGCQVLLLAISEKIYERFMKLYLMFLLRISYFLHTRIQTRRFLHYSTSYHETLNAFDIGRKVHRIFPGFFKVIDKVWHDGLIFKLRQNSNWVEIINILFDFLSNRKHKESF